MTWSYFVHKMSPRRKVFGADASAFTVGKYKINI